MAYSDPDIAAFQSAGEMNLAKQQLGQQRLAQLAEESQFYEQMQYKKQLDEEARRQKEKEEYAKWEKEQILNQVASQLFKDKSANGEFGRMLSPAQQMMEAAKEAARRGQGGYAQEFLAQGQQLAAKEQQAALVAEETRLKNAKMKAEAELVRKQVEAGGREGSNIISETDASGTVRLIDKTTGEIFKEIPGAGKPAASYEDPLKQAQKKSGGVAQADRIIDKVDQATKKISGVTAGTGFAITPESLETVTGARDLASDLNTIKANLGFAELQAMREASPTGGALGQIAVQELLALQSTVASLDQAQSPEQLKERLGEIKAHYQNWKTTMEGKIPKGAEVGQSTSSVGYVETRVLPDGRKIGKKADGSLEIIK